MDTSLAEFETNEDTQRDKYLTFSLGNESFGIDISHVTEIIGVQPITQIPELPAYVRGIINLRGKIIPVMDVRTRFKKQPREYDDRTCIIVVDIEEASMGLIVDSVADVITIPESDISQPPKISTQSNQYVKGIGRVGEIVKLLLDLEKLLTDDELDQLHSAL